MSKEIEMTKSAAKREARRKEIQAEKSKANLEKFIGVAVGVIIAGVFIFAIAMGVWQSLDVTTSACDYGACLTDEGYIAGAKLDKANAIDFNSVTIPLAEVDYREDDIDSDIESTMSGYAYFDDTVDKAIEDGDTINLDYTGSVDGVEFEGGSTNGEGYELEIGSGSFVGDFEEQMIGHKIGDEFSIEVTFPDEYENNPDLAGKLTNFDIKINSIKVTPELTDEFVAENFSENAGTVAEYRAYIKEEGKKEKLADYITKYISDNAKASSIPSAYIKHLRAQGKYEDEQNFEMYNNFYAQYMGYTPYQKLSDYTGAEGRDYEVQLKQRAKEEAALRLTYEATFKKAGLSISDEDYQAAVDDLGDEETFGKAFIMQQAIKTKVEEYAQTVVKIQ